MPTDVHIDQAALQELRSVLGDDFSVLVRTYVTDSETRLGALRAAAAAADRSALREAAHSLKGSSLNIGASHLAELCLVIEQAARGGDLAGVSAMVDAIEAEFRLVTPLLAGSH